MLSKSWVSDPLLNSDAFAYVNQFFFALSNGIVTSKPLSNCRWLLRAGILEGNCP
jgi:hypothetical protein